MGKKELGIYIHIPFCKQKCYYCDFVSYTNKQEMIERYIEAVKKEIESYNLNEYVVTTIYIGGGTPSVIEAKYIKGILNKIRNTFEIHKNCEITIEVNPGTVNLEKLKMYKEEGVNRLSIGLQTTSNILLKQIGRIHTYEEFLTTYTQAKNINFENINIDLIIGLPSQTNEHISKQLKQVLGLNPSHISIYSLIVEEGTALKKMIEEGKLKLPEEEIERRMYWNIKETLERNGYIHYEISNFAKKGYESKHNLNCWEQKEYIGVGLASHSYIKRVRYSNTENLEKYVENIEKNKINLNRIIHEKQEIEDEQKEYILLGLRKIEGISISKFEIKFNCNPIMIFREQLNKLVNEELLEIDGDNIKLTNKGIDFANLVWQEFV